MYSEIKAILKGKGLFNYDVKDLLYLYLDEKGRACITHGRIDVTGFIDPKNMYDTRYSSYDQAVKAFNYYLNYKIIQGKAVKRKNKNKKIIKAVKV